MKLSDIKKDTFEVIVRTNSPKTELVGYDKEKKIFKINLKAEPEKGKANKELVKFLKKELKSEVDIIKGLRSKRKVIKISKI